MIGTMLSNRYEIMEKIGEGGMAEVYKAKCHKLNRFDAIKILKKEYAKDVDLVEKFKREATAIANLSDNNIVNIFDVGSQDDINYIVMEYVKGKTLKQIIRENGKLNYEKAMDIATQIAKALDCAHRNNIIHRDIKPQNILVTEEGLVKVTDFGIAKSPDSATITNSGKILGSAHYFSPEQAKGTYVDGRTDIYSLGIVLYEMVTGRVPFDAESPVSVALKHIQEPVVPPKQINDRIPESLNRLILKCIEKEPIRRYQSIKDLLSDLIKIQKDSNYEIVSNSLDDDFTRVMQPVNVGEQDDDDDNNDRKNKLSSKKKKYIIFSLIGVLVICLGVLSAAILSKINTSSNKPSSNKDEVAVPSIKGLSLEEAKKALEAKNLKLVEAGSRKSDKPENTVLECYPEEGQNVKIGTEVRVIISGGVSSEKVPDLKGVDKNSAQDMLKAYDLELVVKDYAFNDTVPKDAVISQDPAMDTEVKKGGKVNVILSKGPEIKLTKVPEVKGLDIAKAEELITKTYKLSIKKTIIKTQDKDLDNKVESQSIPAGTEVKEGTTVDVKYYVYEEPAKVLRPVPELINKSIKDAKQIAAANKFNLNAGAFKDEDIIEAISPAPNTNAEENSTITVIKVKAANPKP